MTPEKINDRLIDEALELLLLELVREAMALRPQLATSLQESQAMGLTIGKGQLYDKAYHLFRQTLRQEIILQDIQISEEDIPF